MSTLSCEEYAAFLVTARLAACVALFENAGDEKYSLSTLEPVIGSLANDLVKPDYDPESLSLVSVSHAS